MKKIVLLNTEIHSKPASYSRFWLVWQGIRRQI